MKRGKNNLFFYGWLMMLALLAAVLSACQPPASNKTAESNVNADKTADAATETARQPAIEAEGLEPGEGNYKIIAGDNVKLTIRAANANRADLFYKPVTATDRLIKLRSFDGQSNGEYVAELNAPEDFNGEIWARVRYANGESRETERLLLARRDAITNKSDQEQTSANSNAVANNAQTKQTDTDESARADKFTGGKIERTALIAGDGNVKVTVNVPAFTLTLWQNGKEIEKYPVGVGRKAFPIPIGMRSADKIILNPNWIPPDSEWVRESGIEPYEKIPASDADNPLGKIKIPLGDAYLLHEAQAPSDIGNLVSHGCVRVLREDIFDLSQKIATARGLTEANSQIKAARNDSERRVLDLNGEIPVDINYDSIMVENGKLGIYPDVYDRQTNTIENLRAELQAHGVDVSGIDEKTLGEMLDKVTDEKFFSVSLSDIKAGNALRAGKTEPLTPQQSKR